MAGAPAPQLDWLARLQAAAPLALAAALAGFTWWLVASSPEPAAPRRSQPVSSVPDHELGRARLARFDAQGRLQAVLDGQVMRHYPARAAMEIDTMALAARHADGRRMTATAEHGEWLEDSGQATLSGGADVLLLPAPPEGQALGLATQADRPLPPGAVRVLGEHLWLDTQARRLRSEEPVTVLRDRSQVNAQSLDHDEAQGLTWMGGRVRGRLVSSTP